MSRIYWDSMLFAYLMDDHPAYSSRIKYLLKRAYARGDTLYTSYFALGEIMAGAAKSSNPAKRLAVRETLDEMGFSFLEFGAGAVIPFSQLRSRTRLKSADSIHLACAASAGMDLFLTGDKQLIGLHVPGVQFVADFNAQIL